MIRDNGMIPGLSAHMPEMIVYSDANVYDVETYIQIYNCVGFLMQVEIAMVFFEKRPPDLEGRNSPNKTAVIK